MIAPHTSPHGGALHRDLRRLRALSAPLRDLLLQLATSGLFRAKWSPDIHEEWIGAVLRKRKDLKRAQLERTRELMDAHTHDCVVTGYQALFRGSYGTENYRSGK